MCTRCIYGDVTPENVLKFTEKIGQDIAKSLREEKSLTGITCSIEILPGKPMKYELSLETIDNIKTLN